MQEPYSQIRDRIVSLTALDGGLPNLVATEPSLLSKHEVNGIRDRHPVIREFMSTALSIFFESLDGEIDPSLANDYFRDLPESFGAAFHLSLPRAKVGIPQYFRTDETYPGIIAEIQCPGSGWGEQSLLHDFYSDVQAHQSVENCVSTAVLFNDALAVRFQDPPTIQHFVENSSSFLSNALHIAYSRHAPLAPRYWGYDSGVRALDCNFVRTHLFVSLLSENFTRVRLARFEDGSLLYDLPPVCIFEQKLLLHLPFDKSYSSFFPDECRAMFAFTSVVRPSGITLENGDLVTLEKFVGLPRKNRQVFLKYAGIDPSRNWGAQAVYHAGELSKTQLRNLLNSIEHEYRNGGGLWIAQSAHPHPYRMRYFSPEGGIRCEEGYCKYSSFYGPRGFISANIMSRNAKKVHGQPNTVVSLAIEDKGVDL